MNKELIIDSTKDEVNIALLENKLLVELHKEKKITACSVGDVFLGRVNKFMPGLNACFVDIGFEKEGFLHHLDMGTSFPMYNRFTQSALRGDRSQTNIRNYKLKEESGKNQKINSILKNSQTVLVQISKEPISTKGPRLTTQISFAGRYLVLVPFSNKISVSQKIKTPEERARLRNIIQSIRPQNFGVIIRTVAQNRSVKELDSDLRYLENKWNAIEKQLYKAKPCMKVCSEMDKTVSILRDFLSEDFVQIVVNDLEIHGEVREYINKIAPEKISIVKQYKGREPIFDAYGVTKQIKASFGKVVNLKKNGAYLIVEHTEAMHVIDVNSGHRVSPDKSPEINALQVNMDAALEIARQLRLRDMGGIIIVDFIDQREAANRKLLFEAMSKAMATDPARHTVLPPSKFGLIQITRQRFRPQTQVETRENCPLCGGTGEISPTTCIIEDIERDIEYLIRDVNARRFYLVVNPFVYTYLTASCQRMQWKWFFRYKRWIRIKSYDSMNFLDYRFYSSNGEEILLEDGDRA